MAMEVIRGTVTLANPTRTELAPIEVSALADRGAVHLCIAEHLAIQLSLSELKRREVVLGNEVLWGQSPWKTWTWC